MPARPDWIDKAFGIRQRVLKSKHQHFNNEQIQDFFGVKRATASTIMIAIGNIVNLGNVFVVPRESVEEFLEELHLAESAETAYKERSAKAAKPPKKPKPIKITIPEEYRRANLHKLPPNIIVEPGRLEIKGDAFKIIEAIGILGRALEIDQDSFENVWNKTPEVDLKLQLLLSGLRKKFGPPERQPDAPAVSTAPQLADEDRLASLLLPQSEDDDKLTTILIGCPW